jgi:hypothetical protein
MILGLTKTSRCSGISIYALQRNVFIELGMMALGGEELDERRASLSICPGFSSARPRKQRGRRRRCLRRQVGRKGQG